MPLTSLATHDNTSPATAKNGRKLRISGKVRAAIDHMVWSGMKRAEAAQAAGLKDQSMYVAMRKHDVRAYYLAECEVLRVSGRARRIHRLEQMAEQDENKQAAVNAIRALDNIPEEMARGVAAQSVPGMVIQIITAAPLTRDQRVIDVKANEINASGPIDE